MKKLVLIPLVALALACPTKKDRTPIDLDPGDGVNTAEFSLPTLHEEQLSNGLQVLVIEDDRLPTVLIGMTFRSGTSSDPADKVGLTATMMAMLEKGTERKSALQIAEAIDFVGGQIVTSADEDSSTILVRSLKKDFPVAMDLLQDMVMRPTFPSDQLTIVQRALVGGVKQRLDNPEALGAYHMRAMVYGDTHPYGFGTSERSIAAITRKDLEAHHASFLRPNNGYLVVAGDIDKDAVYRKIKLAFGPWEKTELAEVELPAVPQVKRRVRIVDKPDLTQSTIYIAHPGVSTRDDDYYASALMNYAVGGGGFSSRLMKSLRSEEGKTYGVGSAFSARKGAGHFQVHTSTRNEETVESLELMLGVLSAVKESGISDTELREGKGKFVGSYPVRLETLSAKVQRIVTALVHDRGIDSVRNYRKNIASITIEQANAAAAQHLDPDNAIIVVVGKAADIEKPLVDKFGEDHVEVVPFVQAAHKIDQ